MLGSVEKIRRFGLALCVAGGLVATANASAETKMVKAMPSATTQYSFTALPDDPFISNPSNYDNTPTSINNSNIIVGSENGQSYILVQPDYYAPITNSTGFITATGLSNGAAPIVTGSLLDFGVHAGFVRTNGTLFVVVYPGTTISTSLSSVNANGIAVGSYIDSAKVSHALRYNNTDGTIRTLSISHPGLSGSAALGINDHDVIVGSVSITAGNNSSHTYGFFGSGDSFTIVTFADTIYSSIEFNGINNKGIAVGSAVSNGVTHGLLYDTTTNMAHILDAPLISSGTTITGINDTGAIVGFYPVSNGKGGNNTVGFVAYP